jgi:hypothetical protein
MRIAILAATIVALSCLIFVTTHSVVNAEIKPTDFNSTKNMKVVKAGNDVYMVFQAVNQSSNKEDIYLKSSHDGGKNYNFTNLSNGRVLLDVSKGKPSDVEQSFNPQVAVDKEGDVYVVWYAKTSGNPSYVVLDISKDKFATPVMPFVNMTKANSPATDLSLINDETSGGVNLYYLSDQGPQDPCKTRCG